jgi:thiol-disulfide isomerase/thioredoxin
MDNGVEVVTLSDLRPGADVPDHALALAAPAGYEVKKVEAPAAQARAVAAPESRELVGKPAPDWTLKDPSGVEHRLADYRGKVLVVDFWATWCHWCKLGMPDLQRLQEKYKGKGVEVIGIAVWESGDPVKYMKDNNLDYTLLKGSDELPSLYGIQGIPRLVVIGRDGTIVHDTTGYDPQAFDDLSAVVDKALAK